MIGRHGKALGIGALAALVAVPAGLPAASAQAQTQTQAQQASAPVCMVRLTTGGPRGDRPLYLILHPSRVSIWTARGFAEAPCEGRERSLPLVAERMCALAARGDDAGGGAFRRVHGISAEEICALARELEGGR